MKYLIIMSFLLQGCSSFSRHPSVVSEPKFYDVSCLLDGVPLGDSNVEILEKNAGYYKLKSSRNKILYVPTSSCVVLEHEDRPPRELFDTTEPPYPYLPEEESEQ